MALDDAYHHCAGEARRYDGDRLAGALFAPPVARRGLVALLAFNLELARLRDHVREPMLGAMRLQWWRDGLEGIYAGTPRVQPVAMALADAVARHAIPRALLEALIDGRERDFDDTPFATLADVEVYVSGSSGVLGATMTALLGGDASAQDLARRAGTAFGLVGLARAVPFHAGQGRWLLPEDLLRASGVDREATALGRFTPELGRVLSAMTVRAAEIAPLPGSVSRALRPAVLPAPLAIAQARRLAASGHDPFKMETQVSPLRRALVLGRAFWLGV